MYVCLTHRQNKTCQVEYDNEELSPEKLLRWLSDPCRYDKTIAPEKFTVRDPIVVFARIHVYYLTSVYPRNLVSSFDVKTIESIVPKRVYFHRNFSLGFKSYTGFFIERVLRHKL